VVRYLFLDKLALDLIHSLDDWAHLPQLRCKLDGVSAVNA
jgi:hypothetical protein